MEENAILVKNLSKRFKGFHLDDITFNVPKGRIVGFIGENGAGKSTTINLLLNELKRESGIIQIFGLDNLQYEGEIKQEIGVVFDECNFHDFFTPSDVAKILSGVYLSWDDTLFLELMDRFNLLTDKQIGSFSKGKKMKFSLVCALSHRPKLLILDEATTGLDPVTRDDVLDLFLDFIQEEENSILFSSHITSDLEKIADYVILIHDGKIIFEEPKDDLLYNYGLMRCKKEAFASIDKEDYIAYRTTNVSVEFLLRNKDEAKRKYKNMVIDTITIDEIMLFFIKGEMK